LPLMYRSYAIGHRTSQTSCSQFRPLVITHFNTTVSTFRDCFQRIGKRPRGRRFVFPQYPAIEQFTLSSSWLRVYLREVHCVPAHVTRLHWNHLMYAFYTSTRHAMYA
jgi:hypothetical protein